MHLISQGYGNKGIGSGIFLKEFSFYNYSYMKVEKVTMSLISFKLNAAVLKKIQIRSMIS